MKPTIGWITNLFKWNSAVAFINMAAILIYIGVLRPLEISPIIQAAWFAAACDCIISSIIVLALKYGHNASQNFHSIL